MSLNPWLSIPLADYEGHMSSVGVRQLAALSELFRRALETARPASVAVLGVAGGNGLEQVDGSVTKRVVGIDINPMYLEEVRRRFGMVAGLELHCRDLGGLDLGVDPVDLVHAALVFEHVGVGAALENAISLVAAEGMLSVVLQMQGREDQAVGSSGYASIQRLKEEFALVDIDEFQELLSRRGFRVIEEQSRPVPGGKTLWLGVFGPVSIWAV